MNTITNKPELDPLQIHIDGELSRLHEVKRYGVFALKMIGYGAVQLGRELGECALIMESMLEPVTPDKQ